jgi:hypothetical protein
MINLKKRHGDFVQCWLPVTMYASLNVSPEHSLNPVVVY